MEDQFQKILQGLTPVMLAFAYMLAAQYAVRIVTWIFQGLVLGVHELQDQINATKLGHLLKTDDFIMDRLLIAVEATRDSLVDTLKAKSADGKLTPEEARQARDKAWQTFRESLTPGELQHLVNVVGEDLEAIVRARIPGVVAVMKLPPEDPTE